VHGSKRYCIASAEANRHIDTTVPFVVSACIFSFSVVASSCSWTAGGASPRLSVTRCLLQARCFYPVIHMDTAGREYPGTLLWTSRASSGFLTELSFCSGGSRRCPTGQLSPKQLNALCVSLTCMQLAVSIIDACNTCEPRPSDGKPDGRPADIRELA
jgi:hypothetical protein